MLTPRRLASLNGTAASYGRSSPVSVNENGSHQGSTFAKRRHFECWTLIFTFFSAVYMVDRAAMGSIQRTFPTIPVITDEDDGSFDDEVEGIVTEARLQNKGIRSFVLEGGEFEPRICWLMSYPNSGTSYTMNLVSKSSNKSFATNYGDEVTAPDQTDSLSIYPRFIDGPFWAGMSGKIATPRELPEKFVLTKTHCGSRCLRCGPEKYLSTPEQFLEDCSSGKGRRGSNRRYWKARYPPNRVYKAIHLLRNPFHNIVARFHLDIRNHVHLKKDDWVETHPNDVEGFHTWCKELDDMYAGQTQKHLSKFQKLIKDVPCHGEFFKYTQWHNLAQQSLELISHEVPVLTVHYEDYALRYNETVDTIFDFMELKRVMASPEFAVRSNSTDYFTKDQEKKVRTLVKAVATNATWEKVKRYF